MLEGTNQDVRRTGFAELTGMARQLTTPSRHHHELVDIWFEVQWAEHDTEWDESFKELANGRRPDPDTPSFWALCAYSANCALIVARQVPPNESAWQKIEAEAAALVAMVNSEVAARRSPPRQPRGPGSWTLRMRDASAFLASILWLNEQKPRLDQVAKVPIRVSHGPSSTGR
jgi:hypothetical protein